MGLGNCFAVYSAGMAVGAPECGQVFVVLVILGTTLSLMVRRHFGASKFLKLDSPFYTVAAMLAVFLTPTLNGILPSDGIPPDVTTAGWLCWMLTFGSFLTWRDRTLLFQAVPTIALFGLIGCYDTFAPAPFLFFAFLLCLATLLGRAHSREMLRMAVQSGYFNRADSPMTVSEEPEQSPELYEAIKRGPWRWLAGPEWALLSGLVIVIFSVLGAPVIRQAVAPFSGAMRVFAPRRMRNTPQLNIAPSPSNSYDVGRGPITNANGIPRPQFVAQLDKMRYLRTAVFDQYTGHGWRSTYSSPLMPSSAGLGPDAIAQMRDKASFRCAIQRLTQSETIPLPAEVVAIDPQSVQLRTGGSGFAEDGATTRFDVTGVESQATPKDAIHHLERPLLPCLDASLVPKSVQDFALSAAAGGKSDYEKAELIMRAIGARCKYFKGASAVPSDSDAADFFLNGSKVGYCDLFATAMVTCARSVNIPAHFCLGYLPDAKFTDSDNDTTIFDQDYHAWAELYFKDVGWVVFDATGEAQSIDPAKPSTGPSWFANAFPIILNVGIGFAVVGVITIFLIPILGKSKKPTSNPSRAELRKIYGGFAGALASFTGEKRQIHETADEYQARLISLLTPEAVVASSRLNGLLNTAMYGPEELDEAAIKGLREEIKKFRNLLKHQLELKK